MATSATPALGTTAPGITPATTDAIVVDHLTRQFEDFTAVDHISFTVHSGEVFGFLGPNGAGKSTTIKMLCALLRPTSGTASVNGFDVVRDPAHVRQSIGIIFQDYSLDDRITAEENLRFHCMIYHVPPAAREARIREVLTMVNLTDRAKDRVRTYSGGMKRRLEIARGLLHHPAVLFLDEPTLGLDPQTREDIWQHIFDLRQREGITVFMTTHYMDEAEHCDRIGIIDHARIIALDTPAALKGQMEGDVVRLRTADNAMTQAVLQREYDITAVTENGALHFTVAHGDTFVPGFLRSLPVDVQAVDVTTPTLNDVFLRLTGRAIRDDGVSGGEQAHAALAQRARRRT